MADICCLCSGGIFGIGGTGVMVFCVGRVRIVCGRIGRVFWVLCDMGGVFGLLGAFVVCGAVISV